MTSRKGASDSRPQTLAQARRAYNKNGPRISEHERRVLLRGHELMERADKIKEKERRQKEARKKREEREEQQRRESRVTPLKVSSQRQCRVTSFFGLGRGQDKKDEEEAGTPAEDCDEEGDDAHAKEPGVRRQDQKAFSSGEAWDDGLADEDLLESTPRKSKAVQTSQPDAPPEGGESSTAPKEAVKHDSLMEELVFDFSQDSLTAEDAEDLTHQTLPAVPTESNPKPAPERIPDVDKGSSTERHIGDSNGTVNTPARSTTRSSSKPTPDSTDTDRLLEDSWAEFLASGTQIEREITFADVKRSPKPHAQVNDTKHARAEADTSVQHTIKKPRLNTASSNYIPLSTQDVSFDIDDMQELGLSHAEKSSSLSPAIPTQSSSDRSHSSPIPSRVEAKAKAVRRPFKPPRRTPLGSGDSKDASTSKTSMADKDSHSGLPSEAKSMMPPPPRPAAKRAPLAPRSMNQNAATNSGGAARIGVVGKTAAPTRALTHTSFRKASAMMCLDAQDFGLSTQDLRDEDF